MSRFAEHDDKVFSAPRDTTHSLIDPKHHLAAVLSRIEVLVCLSRGFQGEHPVQAHADTTRLNQREDLLAHTAQNLGLLSLGAAAQVRGVHREPVRERVCEVHLGLPPALQPNDAQVPAVGEGVQVVLKVPPTHDVQDVVCAAATGLRQHNIPE